MQEHLNKMGRRKGKVKYEVNVQIKRSVKGICVFKVLNQVFDLEKWNDLIQWDSSFDKKNKCFFFFTIDFVFNSCTNLAPSK